MREKSHCARIVVGAAVSAVIMTTFGASARADWSVFDKDIPQLETALENGLTTDVGVVQQYLDRISTFNKHGGGDGTLGGGGNGLNAVAQVNPTVLSDAARVDALIKSGATTADYPLLGVPVLVKNSYDVAGLTTTNGVSVLNGSGTAGSTTLIAKTDAPSIAALKAEGAIIIGKASMSTMAYSFNGIDNASGVVENPYNPTRQPGGSSSGIGVGITAQFAMLGMGGETGGSIRIPSSYNADVGLKTSAGLINPAGTFPLVPTRDVVGPIAKSVTDVAYAMNALVQSSSGNLFSGTAYYPTAGVQPGAVGTGLGEGSDSSSKGLTTVTGTRPTDYTSFLSTTALQGKVIAVENDVVGTGTQYDGTINSYVEAQFQKSLNVLRAQGATIKFVNLPATVTYYSSLGKSTPTTNGFTTPSGTKIPYPTTTANGTTPATAFQDYAAAYYYEQQLESYDDPVINNSGGTSALDKFALALKNGENGASGSSYSTLNSAYSNILGFAQEYDAGKAAGFDTNTDAQEALAAFTTLRETAFDDYMTANNIDAFVAPTMGDIAPLVTSSLRPGVSSTDPYSNGTAVLIDKFESNILGLPSLSVPMGYFPDGTPMGIQFLDQLDGEAKLIGYGYDFEQATEARVDPNLSFVPEPAGLAMLCVAGMMLKRKRA